MSKTPVDPLRVRLHDLTETISERVNNLRDFATSPGNAWLAKGELQSLEILLADVAELLEEIKEADYEAGY
jgi:hypothetical protein